MRLVLRPSDPLHDTMKESPVAGGWPDPAGDSRGLLPVNEPLP